MNTLLDAVDFGLILVGADGAIEAANRWVRERCPPGAGLAGQPLAQAFGQPVDPRLALAVRSCLDLGNAVRLSQAFHPMPLPLVQPGDSQAQRLRQSVDIIPLPPESPQDGRRCLIQVRDVTESVRREALFKSQARQLGQELARLQQAHREIERQSARFRELARLAPVGLFETDPDGRLAWCNARVAELLGIEVQPLLQRPWTELFAAHCRDIVAQQAGWRASAMSGVRFVAEFCLERPGQRSAWMRVEASAIRQADASSAGHIFTMVDVTELREQAHRHEQRANHDKLTGLVNRDRFEAALHDRLQRQRSGEGDGAFTVMYIDLDHFKQINDGHGHHAGDLVLKAVASRIRRCVRGHDVVGRLGGDEFAVLLCEQVPPEAVERLAGRIEKAVAMPINIGSCHVHVGASVGWSTAGPEFVEGADATQLLKSADAAMYRAKRQRLLRPVATTGPTGAGDAAADDTAPAQAADAATLRAVRSVA